MTDYRALTQGGCIAGSANVDDNGTWTCPSGVHRIFAKYNHYFAVTPGVTYKYRGNSYITMGVYATSGTNNPYWWSMSGRDNIIYWSNDINSHAAELDLNNYIFVEGN